MIDAGTAVNGVYVCFEWQREGSAAEASTGLLLFVLEALREAVDRLWGGVEPLEHLPGEQLERLADVLGAEGGDLGELELVLLGEVVPLLEGDAPLLGLVRLVAHDQPVDALARVPASPPEYLSISWSQKRSPSKDSRSVTS